MVSRFALIVFSSSCIAWGASAGNILELAMEFLSDRYESENDPVAIEEVKTTPNQSVTGDLDQEQNQSARLNRLLKQFEKIRLRLGSLDRDAISRTVTQLDQQGVAADVPPDNLPTGRLARLLANLEQLRLAVDRMIKLKQAEKKELECRIGDEARRLVDRHGLMIDAIRLSLRAEVSPSSQLFPLSEYADQWSEVCLSCKNLGELKAKLDRHFFVTAQAWGDELWSQINYVAPSSFDFDEHSDVRAATNHVDFKQYRNRFDNRFLASIKVAPSPAEVADSDSTGTKDLGGDASNAVRDLPQKAAAQPRVTYVHRCRARRLGPVRRLFSGLRSRRMGRCL